VCGAGLVCLEDSIVAMAWRSVGDDPPCRVFFRDSIEIDFLSKIGYP
jgi:hypothetical protein